MDIYEVMCKALRFEQITKNEGLFLWKHASTSELMFAANALRFKIHPSKEVTWIIDRNVNYTNVCYSGCKFCNFHCKLGSPDAYITSIDEYRQKITEMLALGGNQLLLQGGLHPKLGLDFYTDLFSSLKKEFPTVLLHALGPPEIVHIARKEKLTYTEVLTQLRNAGLDSLPGAGAEVLSDRVRSILSPAKCNTQEWLDVMRAAHKLGFLTSATMMFGHIETIEERLEHLIGIRQVQNEKDENSTGFISFILWPFMGEKTALNDFSEKHEGILPDEYIRMLALSRLMLPNIPNIQASWLTVGKAAGQLCLHGGANDFGSIMIEENVVSAAGVEHKFDEIGIQKAIREAGFEPVRRNQKFEKLSSSI